MFGRRFFRHHHHAEWFAMRGHGRRSRRGGGDEAMGEGGFAMGRGPFGRGPFGRGPFGGRGGGGGRVFGPGDLRLVLLSLIDDKTRPGFEIIKDLKQKFGVNYTPSPGSVYPTLTLLEELGHLKSATTEGTKRLFE